MFFYSQKAQSTNPSVKCDELVSSNAKISNDGSSTSSDSCSTDVLKQHQNGIQTKI